MGRGDAAFSQEASKPQTRSVRRIGGEFEVDSALLETPAAPLESLPGAGYFATGRAALAAILRDVARGQSGRDVLIPDYICQSVPQTVIALGLRPVAYPVSSSLTVDVDRLVDMATTRRASLVAAVFVDYFGLSVCDEWVTAFKAEFPGLPVIRDCVQSLHEVNAGGPDDYRFASLRKWIPTPDGAPVFSREAVVPVPSEGEGGFVAQKLLGNLERYWTRDDTWGAEDHAYAHVEVAEAELDATGVDPARMSCVGRVILSRIDLEAVALRRRSNFEKLATLIGAYGLQPMLELAADRVPHFLPIQLPNRDRVCLSLQADAIFCPVHWPVPRSLRGAAHGLWETELSLVVDQRYGVEDMERLSGALQRILAASR